MEQNKHESYDELHAKLYPQAAQKQEYITCAAIHYKDNMEYKHQPKNIDVGFVIAGHRHHNIIAIMHQLLGDRFKGKDCVQGFLTSKDRFVDRQEGGHIAKKAAQITRECDCLFSEDIY